MSDFGSFFDPSAIASAAQAPDTNQLRQQWDLYLNDPKTQAALLSFGAQVAQPMQFGQSGFGHLLSSVAQGGAGVRQVEEQDRKQQDIESKAGLREAQADAAEARARASQAGSGAAAERLSVARIREEGLRERSQLQRRVQAYKLYGDYAKATQKANQDAALMRQPTQPVLSPAEWFQRNRPLMESIGITPEMLLNEPAAPVGDGGSAPNAAPPSGASPAPASSAGGAATPPPASTRPDGFIFEHPTRGRMRWDKSQQRWFPAG